MGDTSTMCPKLSDHGQGLQCQPVPPRPTYLSRQGLGRKLYLITTSYERPHLALNLVSLAHGISHFLDKARLQSLRLTQSEKMARIAHVVCDTCQDAESGLNKMSFLITARHHQIWSLGADKFVSCQLYRRRLRALIATS